MGLQLSKILHSDTVNTKNKLKRTISFQIQLYTRTIKYYITYFDRQKHRGCCEIWRFHNIWLRCLEFPYHILCIYTISQQTLRPYIPTEGIIYLSIRFFPMSDKFNFQSSLLMSQSPSCFPILPGFHA